jgi:hypothetical protein
MVPFRKGDGTGLGAKGFSEIRKGDGTVLWSAGPDIPDSVVDNYEDADANPAGPYESGQTIADYYSGDTGSFERASANVGEGSHSLAINTPNDAIYSHPGDGLPEYPQEGDVVSFLLRGTDDSAFPVALSNVQDDPSPNCYGYELDIAGGRISIFRYDGGNFDSFGTRLNQTNVAVSAGTWYLGEVSLPESGNNNISFDLYNFNGVDKGSFIGSVNATDNNVSKTNRGIGWTTRTGSISSTPTHFDRYGVE